MKRIITLIMGVLLTLPLVGDELEIIANNSAPVDKLSHEGLYDIFVFQTDIWENGEEITVVTLPLNNIEHRAFLEKYTGLNYLGYMRRFNNRIDSGKGKPPIAVRDFEEMLATVATKSGSIGYSIETIRTFMAANGIKVIEIY